MPITVCETMRLARYSYMNPSRAKSSAERDGFDNVVFLSKNGTQCLCVEKDGEFACAFRGTDYNIQEWISNVDAKRIDNQFGPGALHRGFSNELEVIWPEVSKYVGNEKHVHMIGHSKGGALANIAALRMLYDHINEITLWTFGSPRCMSAKAAAEIELHCRVIRVVNFADPVTWFPRGWWGFKHAGNALYFRGWNQKMIEGPPYAMVWWDAISELAKNIGCWRKLMRKYHLMSHYMLKIIHHLER